MIHLDINDDMTRISADGEIVAEVVYTLGATDRGFAPIAAALTSHYDARIAAPDMTSPTFYMTTIDANGSDLTPLALFTAYAAHAGIGWWSSPATNDEGWMVRSAMVDACPDCGNACDVDGMFCSDCDEDAAESMRVILG